LTPGQPLKPQRLTIIAFDLINMPTLRQGGARKALWDFLAETAGSMEPTAVYSIGSKGVSVVVDFTTDPRLVREALDRLKLGRRVAPDASVEGKAHAGPAFHSESDQNVSPSPSLPGSASGSGRMSAIITQMEALQQEIELNITSQLRRYTVLETLTGLQQIAQACSRVPGRKSLLWVTGGFPFDISPTDMMIRGQEATFRGGRRDWSDVYPDYLRTWRALNDAEVVLYPIDVRGITNPMLMDPSIHNLNDQAGSIGTYGAKQNNTTEYAFAYATGGKAFFGSSDLKQAFEQAVHDADQYYELGFYITPDQHTKPGWHPISVKTSRQGTELRARSGYFYNATAADLDATRERDLSTAVFSPIDFTAITLTARWMGVKQAEIGKQVDFELVMPADFVDLDTSENQIRLDIVAQVKTLEGKPVGQTYSRSIDGKLNDLQARQLRERGFTYAGQLALAPGDYFVRFVVRDGLNGHMGSVTAPLKVQP
jgi:VWFA-related protein